MMVRSDRPWPRKLVRFGFQLLGRDHAHRQDTWPSLHIDRAASRALWRGQPLVTLCEPEQIIPIGLPTITVVGSGPSLRGQHIEAIGDQCAILCNGAATLIDRIHPLAVAVEDERFVFRHYAMLVALSKDIPVLLSPAAMRAWAERDMPSLQGRPIVLINNLAKPVGERRRSLDDPNLKDTLVHNGSASLSRKPADGVVITGTVAFTALQFALAAAPLSIRLAGIDLTNDALPRFYETSERAKSGLSAGLPRILAGFSLALEYAARRGIGLSCASPVSALLGLGYEHDENLDHQDA